MAIVSFQIDPGAGSQTGDQIVTAINGASSAITRASSVSAAARPIGAGEVDNTALAATAAKDNLDALADTARGYIKTAPTTGEFPVVNVQRDASGNLDVDYDNVAI